MNIWLSLPTAKRNFCSEQQVIMSKQVLGHITQIIGPVVDVYFDSGEADLPKIHDALQVVRPNGKILVLECQQHIGEDSVRTIAMDSTDGLMRGMEVTLTGKPISIPIGNQIKGRLLNVTGDAIDGVLLFLKFESSLSIEKSFAMYVS